MSYYRQIIFKNVENANNYRQLPLKSVKGALLPLYLGRDISHFIKLHSNNNQYIEELKNNWQKVTAMQVFINQPQIPEMSGV